MGALITNTCAWCASMTLSGCMVHFWCDSHSRYINSNLLRLLSLFAQIASVKSDFFHLKSIAEAVFKKSAYTSYTVKEVSSNIYSYALNYDEKHENILSLGKFKKI